MLLCVLAIIIIILASFFVAKKDCRGYKLLLAYLFTLVISGSLLLCGILVPISGYEEPIVIESELMPIVNDSNIYIIEKSDRAVICKYIDEDTKEEDVYTFTDNVEVITVEEGKKPILKSSVTKARKTIFTFGLLQKTENTFYVPESNIERWQEKHVD